MKPEKFFKERVRVFQNGVFFCNRCFNVFAGILFRNILITTINL